jgi:hypothetical protein
VSASPIKKVWDGGTPSLPTGFLIPNRHLQRLVAAPGEATDVIGPSMIIFVRSGQ